MHRELFRGFKLKNEETFADRPIIAGAQTKPIIYLAFPPVTYRPMPTLQCNNVNRNIAEEITEIQNWVNRRFSQTM